MLTRLDILYVCVVARRGGVELVPRGEVLLATFLTPFFSLADGTRLKEKKGKTKGFRLPFLLHVTQNQAFESKRVPVKLIFSVAE